MDRETEELRHSTVSLDVGKLIQKGRLAKGFSQKDLATVSFLYNFFYIQTGLRFNLGQVLFLCFLKIVQGHAFLRDVLLLFTVRRNILLSVDNCIENVCEIELSTIHAEGIFAINADTVKKTLFLI